MSEVIQRIDPLKFEAALLAESGEDLNNTAWGQLYGALVNQLGVSPMNFQMLYPFMVWDWKVEPKGFTSASQYNFQSTLPQWSAVGAYTSAGRTFHQGYQAFLNAIDPATDDPKLQQELAMQWNNLQLAINDLETVSAQAKVVYADEVGPSNDPPYSQWLGTPSGLPFKTRIEAASKKMMDEQLKYDQLVDRTQSQALKVAQALFADQQFYTKLDDPGLKDFPAQPAYSVDQTSAQWVQKAVRGDVPSGELVWTTGDASFDYRRTWAGGSASVGRIFWSVNVNGSWERLEQLEKDKTTSIQMTIKGWDQISMRPQGWYDSGFLMNHRKGKFLPGYSGDKNGSDAYFWGSGGTLSLLKTGMVVAYQPSFTIKMSQSTYDLYREKFQAALGFRIGPFTFGSSGGHETETWNKQVSDRVFSGEMTGTLPVILGININEMPA
jgi:hypothetical protein